MSAEESTIHGCPVGDGGTTPCCDMTPFELPLSDRMTLDGTAVTCGAPLANQPGHNHIPGVIRSPGECVRCDELRAIALPALKHLNESRS